MAVLKTIWLVCHTREKNLPAVWCKSLALNVKLALFHRHSRLSTCAARINRKINLEKIKGKKTLVETGPRPRYKRNTIRKLKVEPLPLFQCQQKTHNKFHKGRIYCGANVLTLCMCDTCVNQLRNNLLSCVKRRRVSVNATMRGALTQNFNIYNMNEVTIKKKNRYLCFLFNWTNRLFFINK